MSVKINPEYSAQRKSHPPNPFLLKAISYLQSMLQLKKFGRVCDLGCGKLRHFDILTKYSDFLLLVDTEYQINTPHIDSGKKYIIRDLIMELRNKGNNVDVMSDLQFKDQDLKLDLIFLINVTDVVTKSIHSQIIRAAHLNLKQGGTLVVLFPRNDSSITRRFNESNRYQDGHLFNHHSIKTFMRNIADTRPVVQQLARAKFQLLHDGSRHKQVLLVFKKQ